MDVKSLDAMKAYAQANETLKSKGSPSEAGAAGSFAGLVSDALGDVRQASSGFEATAAKTLTGQSDIVDVVTAASNAEMMVQTVVTVRDRVIDAYKQIIRMPI